MKPEAVKKARSKLARAQSAVSRIQSSESLEAIEQAWEDFVMACSTFYSALEQGSKAAPKSSTWFARKKGERRKDPLLKYLHQARNAEEHGLRRITARASGEVTLKPGAVALMASDGRAIRILDSNGMIVSKDSAVCLVSVRDDRFNDTFEVPTEHMGKKLENWSPLDVADLALDYLSGMLTEAEELSRSTAIAK